MLLFAGGANAQDLPPDPPPEDEDKPGVLDTMLTNIPDQDLSWVLGRTLVGEHLWNNAADFVPDPLLRVTLGENGMRLIGSEEGRAIAQQMDAWVPSGLGQQRALTVSSVLGDVTWLITQAGTAIMAVFGIFFLIQQTYGFGAKQGGMKIGWAPARLGASLLFLMPVSREGFCAIQAVVAVCIQIGIGGANMTWDRAVDDFNQTQENADPSKDPAVQAARDLLDIPGEELVMQALAAGLCRGVVNARAGQAAQEEGQPRIGPSSPYQYLQSAWNECGEAADSAGAKKQIRQLAEIYEVDGLDDYLIEQVHEPREALLKTVQSRAENWASQQIQRRSASLLMRKAQRFSALTDAAYQGKPVDLLLVNQTVENAGDTPPPPGEEPATVLHNVVPNETQAMWAAIERFGSFDHDANPGHAGACVGEWLSRLKAQPIRERMSQALQNQRGVSPKSINGIDLTHAEPDGYLAADKIWPLENWPETLLLGEEYCREEDEFERKDFSETSPASQFRKWVWELESFGDPEELKDHLSEIYAKQMQGVSGTGDGEGRRGWLMAGALYWQVQVAQRTDSSVRALITPQFKPIDTDDCAEAIEKERNATKPCFHVRSWNIGMLTAQAIAAVGTDTPPGAYSYDGGAGGLELQAEGGEGRSIAAIAMYLNDRLQRVAKSDTPLMELVDYGATLLTVGGAIWGMGAISNWVGDITGFLPIKVGKRLQSAGGFLKAIGVAFMGLGVMLAIWLPAVPVIAWLTAVWAWVVSIVLALLAAPMWALAHAIPDGHGPLSQYSRKGYELLLFATLRPTLMVVGLLLAISMSSMIVKLGAVMFTGVIASFSDAVAFVNPGWWNWPTNLILVTGMGIVFLTAIFFLVHKTFSLCHQVADRTFEWVGQGQRSLGDNEMLQGASRAAVAVATKAKVTGAAVKQKAAAAVQKPTKREGIERAEQQQRQRELERAERRQDRESLAAVVTKGVQQSDGS